MRKHIFLVAGMVGILLFAMSGAGNRSGKGKPAPHLLFPGEREFLKNLKQLTFEGWNAEAYFSPDGRWLTFQSTRPPYTADQIFFIRPDGSHLHLVSTGKGRTTCSYFFPNMKRILYSSTHLFGDEPPKPPPNPIQRYAWPVFPEYEIFTADRDGKNLQRLTDNWGYDAEGVVDWNTGRIVFTSYRNGDLDLYLMNADGSHLQRLTEEVGYEGGAFFSRDGKRILYRAYHPRTPEEIKQYQDLLQQNLISPPWMEIFVAELNPDGSLAGKPRQLTALGGISFAPYFLPDDRGVIFTSNYEDPKGRNFELYAVDGEGKNLQRITFYDGFDSFPYFSPDGRKLVWSSSRGSPPGKHEINLFIADWMGPGRVPARKIPTSQP